MKLKLTIAILCFCCSACYSQDYLITKTLALNDSIAFTSLQYGRKDFGYGVVNSKGVMDWQIPSPGFPLGMGKFHNKVLVFYTLENSDLRALKDIHAAIVDLKTKKITADKEIYNTENKYKFVPIIINDPAGNFDMVLVRTTSLKRGLASYTSWPDDKFNETTQLSAIYLDDNLNAQTKDIKSGSIGSFFMSACAGNNNDLYLCSYSNDQLTIEKFDRDNNLKSKLSTATSIKDHSAFFPLMQYDSVQGNCIDEAITYKNNHRDDILRTYRYDFNDQKAYASDETPLDKDYKRALEKESGEKKLSNFKSMDELRPVQIVETNDKVIVLKEIQYSFTPAGDDAEQFWRSGSLITMYAKKDLHPERDIVIDKSFGTFIMGGTDIMSHVKNDKLYTVTCELAGAAKYKTYLYITNMNDGVTDSKVLEKEDAGKGWTTHASTVMWFNNNFITPFCSGKAFIHLKFETDLQSESY
ncbi:MAG: hypothetical protein ABI185_06770 [Ginsengibacter sp.]